MSLAVQDVVWQALVKYRFGQLAQYKDSLAISIVTDKTSVGKKDYLFGAVLDPFGKLASWLPPQVAI